MKSDGKKEGRPFRSALALAASAAIVGAAFWTGGTGTAMAAPSGCAKGGGGTYSTAICSGGNGAYQAYATCFNPAIPGATFYKFVEGPWKRAGSRETSTVVCPFLFVVSSRGVGLRN